MTFLVPWALLVGALAAAGLVVLHLVARQRPAVYPLPTARFVPDRRTLISRVSQRPRDIVLLLLRVILVLSAAAAFARPVLSPRHSARMRVLLLDRSSAVADHADARDRARALLSDGVPTRVLAFDSSVVALGSGTRSLDSLARVAGADGRAAGSLSAALAAARRLAAELGAGADSVELVLVSPLTEREVDAATDSIRATWPGTIRVVRLDAVPESATATPPLERAVSDADVLGPALGQRAIRASAAGVRILRGPLDGADSAFARRGGVVVRWDSLGTRAAVPVAVAMEDDVVIAALGREAVPQSGLVLARWADGAPAAVEQALGKGCVRAIGIGVPVAGDLPLSPAFQRIVNGLTGSCVGSRALVGGPLDSSRVAALIGPKHLATGSALASGVERPTPIAPWLLGLALTCALAELLLRRRAEREAA